MNELQILREIAFYSKYINQQKKQMMQQNSRQNYISKPQSTYNKYKYVKKDSTVISSVQNNLANTVLINPNFKQTVLINPHFNVQNRKIHVNPKVLKSQLPSNTFESVNQEQNLSQIPSTCIEHNTTTKNQEQIDEKLTRKRRMSIRSKYKIIKSSCMNNSLKSINKYPSIKTKYKIDRRVISHINKSQTKRKVASSGLSDMLRKNIFKNKIWKRSQLQNNPMITINGTLYKKTKTKLQKVQQSSKLKKLIVIKGQRYTIASNKKSLKRISTIKKRNSTIIIKNKQVERSHSSVNNIRKIRQKNCIQRGNKLRKNNQPCPVYRRYGKCRRKEAGRCNFLHNPNQIFLCKKFLQGECIDKDCLLSHKVSLKKMPTCKYFLEGCCIRNDCPYLHVKINPKADICNEFLKGFCEKGLECNLRHQYLCPVFERTGSCSKRKCMYPHIKKNVEKPKVKIFEKKDEQIESTAIAAVRYYVDNSPVVEVVDNQVNNYINSDFSNSESDNPQGRPRLGSLPSFIPF